MCSKQFFVLIVSLTMVGMVIDCNPNTASVAGSLKPPNIATRVQTRARDPISIVKAYYFAVQTRDIDTALGLLAFEIVMVDLKPAPCSSEVIMGVQALEGLLESSKVLSFSIDDLKVEDDKVTYILTEWLDPRTVGPNYPQPRRSHLIAVVQNGEIASITKSRDPELMALQKDGSQDANCG